MHRTVADYKADPNLQALARALAPTMPATASSKVPDIVTWAEQNYWVMDESLGIALPIRLTHHQKTLLRFMFAFKVNWRQMGWSCPKKSGKTAIAGLVGRYVAENFGPKNEVLCMANDLEQSIGRVYKAAKDSIELNPDFNREKHVLPGQWHSLNRQLEYIPNGTVIKAISSDYKGEAGANPTLTLWTELWGYCCCDENTLLLTSRGWLRYDQVLETDKVATLSENNEFEWQQAQTVHTYDYSGSMLRFQHRRGDMLLTPNHRVLGKYYTHSRYQHRALEQKQKVATDIRTYGGAWHEYAVDAANYAYGSVKADCDYIGTERGTFTLPAAAGKPERIFDAKKWFAFMGWYIAEGCLRGLYKGNYNSVSISQDREYNTQNYVEIDQLLCGLGFGESVHATPTEFIIKDKQLATYLTQFGRSADQHIPVWYKDGSKSELLELFNAYMKGDGWFAGKDGFQCQTTSEQLKDDLLEVGLKCGYIPRYMNLRKLNHPTQKPLYRLSFSNAPIVWQRDNNHWTEEPYQGKVWCVTVPNSTIYVQRNGFCYWTGNSEASHRFWSELTPVPTRNRSFRFIETYAGYTDESDILLDVYNTAVKRGRRLTHEELEPYGGWPYDDQPPVYVNEEAATVFYWDDGEIARRMPWQTPEYYISEAQTLTPEQFNHLHNNFWQNSVTAFLDEQWWVRLGRDDLPPLDRNTPCVLGADASVTSDCTALVLVTRHPERHEDVAQRYVEVWQPTPEHPMDYTNTIEAEIRKLCSQYNVVELAYDPYQLHKMGTDLTREAVVWARPFNQGVDREKADYQLYTMIRDRRIEHIGDPRMLDHIRNAGKHQNKDEDTKLRIVKKGKASRDGGHIDAVVATSMAVAECLRLNL